MRKSSNKLFAKLFRRHRALIYIPAIGVVLLLFQLWLTSFHDELHLEDAEVPIVLWWTPFTSDKERLETCGPVQCLFTENRAFLSHPFLKGILFYGSGISIDDLPIPRQADVDWGLLHEESPRNNPMLVHEDALALFNYSSTFSRYSDVPLTLVDLLSEEDLIGEKYYVAITEKNRLMKNKKLAPLLYIQSNCNTASERDSYIKELMKYIPVDSYGLCLNNQQLPKRLKDDYVGKLNNDEFLRFVAEYKFTLAFENAVCDDYITEKLWRPLMVGSLPVYYGSPSFKDWLPNNNSAISVRDFPTPEALAEFLLEVSSDDVHYEQYFNHKLSTDTKNRISNHRLSSALRNRIKDVPNEFGNYVRAFECHVCQRLHEKDRQTNRHMVTKQEYNCPLPVSPLTHKVNKDNWWVDQWILEKCSAKLLAQHVSNNTRIDLKEIHEKKIKMYSDNKDC